MTRRDRLIIRSARLSDSEALAVLLGELGYPKTDAFAHGKLKQLSKKKGNRVFVVVDEGRVVGFASCHIMPLIHEDNDLCRVTALIVAQDCRRGNIGRRLMRAVEEYARKSGCGRIEITSGQHRHDAHCFYERIGYREVSRRFLKVLGAE